MRAERDGDDYVISGPQAQITPPLGGDFVGQSFPLRRRWEADGLACNWQTVPNGLDETRQLDCSSLVDWVLYRRSAKQPIEERIVLWLRQDGIG